MAKKNRLWNELAIACWRALGYYPTRLEGAPLRADPEDWRFWRKLASGRWEPHTFRILGRFLRPDSVFLDVGAWIGPTALYAARRCARVYAFEPDPYAYERLLRNLRLNRITNVQPLHAALAPEDGVLRIGSPRGLGKSVSSALHGAGAHAVVVPALSPQRFLREWDIRRVDLVKIDIEGGEFALLPALVGFLGEYRPTLYLSLHAPYLAAGARRESLERVAEVLGVFPRLYDQALRPIAPTELSGPGFTERFAEVVAAWE
ncbi:MAG TPA: FkbM family methyltransferase [Candidatus Competibacteraceae bacterium]|nr:FkbM family methyltransferase [Candidatus Competibacteraceae bacterium]